MDICEDIPPEYREVEEGHYCACHLYNSPEDNLKYKEQMEELLRKKREEDQKKLEKSLKYRLFKADKKKESAPDENKAEAESPKEEKNGEEEA